MNDSDSHRQDSSTGTESAATAVSGVLARPGDVMPGAIDLIPVTERPFFPSQVMPLVLNREHWMDTLRHAHEKNNNIVGLVYCDAESSADATAEDFRPMGTACRIHQVHQQEDTLHVVLVGVERFAVRQWISERRPFSARVEYFSGHEGTDTTEIKAYTTAIINVIKELLPLNPLYGEELKQFLGHFGPSDPSRMADFGASLTTASGDELQEVLELLPLYPRLEKTLVLLQKELEIARAQMEIRQHVEKEMQQRQREVFLREQLKFIQKELGISKDDRTAEVDMFRERIEDLDVPDHALARMNEELDKLSVLERGSPEYTVTRNYLDWLTILPWGRLSEDRLDLDEAARVLDNDHEGLDDIKDRIKEFLGVGIMRGSVGGTILLLVGPPGVGKTSLGQSIARALGRRFYRFSLGGMRDEAEIKGHRRTYIGAMPGKFIQALKEAGTSNPVIMLDEVDKIGASFHGDPASALLEVLDPEQNASFLDHYLDVRFDLSNVLFICTANTVDSIPAPLLDRMETLRLAGYLADEKVAIAARHLVPRQLNRAGLRRRGDVSIDRAALRRLVEEYARESGVRRLEKLVARIVRKAVMKLLTGHDRPVRVRATDLEEYVDKPVFKRERPKTGVGRVTGLAWTAMGGTTLTVEARRVHNFGRGFRFTGQLGDVMKESAEIAYGYLLSSADEFDADPAFFRDSTIHLHVPAGATPKDGPSAGITMACALLSLCRNTKPVAALAMTGELTLTGEVLPVGGIREKVVAARRAGIRKLVLPEANRPEFEVLPDNVRSGLKVDFVSVFGEVAALVFP